MQEYSSNKLRTAFDIVRRIENWPTAFEMRLRPKRKGLRLLRFRNGLNVLCRNGGREWDVIHELWFACSYGRAMGFLKELPGKPLVLDLGANIGMFSLLAARTHSSADIIAYEPGPPNYRLFEMNCLANPSVAERIRLVKEAVAGSTRTTEWFFDSENPGASGLFSSNGDKFSVQLRSFSELVQMLPGPIGLAKIDIEGAEFELLSETPAEIWRQIHGVALELHNDPAGKTSQAEFLERMKSYGFQVEEESVCSLFLHR